MKKQRSAYDRLLKWEWKPALAIMYANCCVFAAFSVRLLLEVSISELCFVVQVHCDKLSNAKILA